jgi:protein-tyrosine-phosphatase
MGRSPLFAVALQAQADRRLGPQVIAVGSAGIDASSGDPAAEGSRRVAAEWGVRLEDHRALSTRFAPLEEALLVLPMTRRQRSILVRERPGLTDRTFTLREALPAFGAITDLDEVKTVTDPRERLEVAVSAANLRRPPTRLRRRFDVPDPAGGDQSVYAALGEEFREAAERLADALFGPGPT